MDVEMIVADVRADVRSAVQGWMEDFPGICKYPLKRDLSAASASRVRRQSERDQSHVLVARSGGLVRPPVPHL
jgi:hypothetical protein